MENSKIYVVKDELNHPVRVFKHRNSADAYLYIQNLFRDSNYKIVELNKRCE